jgi:hypothetical protein
LILACIVYWQASEISRVLNQCDPGIDLSLLEHVSPIEWDKVGSMASISSTESPSAIAVAQKESALPYKITRISLVPLFDFVMELRPQTVLLGVLHPTPADRRACL